MLTLGMLAIKWIYWLFTGAWLFPHLSGSLILVAICIGLLALVPECMLLVTIMETRLNK